MSSIYCFLQQQTPVRKLPETHKDRDLKSQHHGRESMASDGLQQRV